MPGPQYTIKQLLSLQNSPLVTIPQDLPAVEQLIESQTLDVNQRKARAQGGFHTGRGDENENPSKRPSLFETRNVTRHSNTSVGDEIFLGPKISFASASASAARQPTKAGQTDDKGVATAHENKPKPEKTGGTEKTFRARDPRTSQAEQQRPRWKSDWKSTREAEPDGEDFESWVKNRHNEGKLRMGDGETLEGELDKPLRRNGQEVGKSELPWNQRGKASGVDDHTTDGDWRSKDRRVDRDWSRGNRLDRAPQWMKDSGKEEMMEHTQEDFQKWKEKMKAGTSSTPDAIPKTEELVQESPADTTKPADKSATPKPVTTTDSFFGLWGDGKKEEKKTEDKLPLARAKSSRFANFFGAASTEKGIPLEPASPPPVRSPVKTSSEDQEGFQRMMEMLRMGGNSSQQPMSSAMGSPPPTHYGPPQQERGQPNYEAGGLYPNEPQRQSQQPISSPEQAQVFPQSPQNPQRPRQESSNRDSEFLMKLMQQPRAPFTEGQIYGTVYERKNVEEHMAFANMYPPNLPQQGNRGPPPGFFNNDRAFAGNQNLEEPQISPANMRSPPIKLNEDRMGMHPSQDMPNEPFRQHSNEQQSYQRMPPNFDQPPWMNGQPPPHGQHEHMMPPPGFPAPGRGGPPPPGFLPYPGNNPPNMRGQGPPGPGFFNGPGSPQGFPGNPQQPRGPPPMHLGFEGYPDMPRQGPGPAGPPPQGQYAQYLKQHGGPGQHYQGM